MSTAGEPAVISRTKRLLFNRHQVAPRLGFLHLAPAVGADAAASPVLS